MTRGGMKEYVDAIRGCYIGAGRKEKSQILDEAVRVTGQHRKAAIGGGKVDHGGGIRARGGNASISIPIYIIYFYWQRPCTTCTIDTSEGRF